MVSERYAERQRKDLQQVKTYTQTMMEKEFPSMGFPNERWSRRMTDGALIYIAHWPCGSAVRIRQKADLWDIALIDYDWTKHLTTTETKNGD